MKKNLSIKSLPKNSDNISSVIRRFVAMFYNWLLCLTCLFVFIGIAVTLNQGHSMTKQQLFLMLGVFGVGLFYWFLKQGGQTPSMKIWKIKLLADQSPASVEQLLISFFVVLLTAGSAIFVGFFRKDKKGMYDLLRRTSLRGSE